MKITTDRLIGGRSQNPASNVTAGSKLVSNHSALIGRSNKTRFSVICFIFCDVTTYCAAGKSITYA